MKKFLVILLFLSSFALAQNPPTAPIVHGGTLKWTNATTPGITGVNIYRCLGTPATCTNSLFTLIATVAAPGSTYSDSTSNAQNPPTAGSTYTWEMTSVCPINGSPCGGEGLPSVQVTATIPLSPPAPTAPDVTPF